MTDESDWISLEYIRNQLKEIERVQGDPEMAHSIEDELYLKVLTAIAEGKCASPKECAGLAIKADAIDFPRWCA